MHNDCDLLTCPAVWLKFFLATSFVIFTLHSYKTIQLFVIHINDGRTAKTSLVFKRYILKMLTICHHIFTQFTAHGRIKTDIEVVCLE